MTSIRTSDVVSQLRRSYEAEAKALAGTNTLISRTEAKKAASSDLRGAIAGITDGQPGVRLTVDRVVDEAVKRALQRLGAVNATGLTTVSRAEVDAIKSRLPDLGNRFAAAYEVAKAGGVPPTPPAVVEAVKVALSAFAQGALPPLNVRLVKDGSTARIAEVDVQRNDGRLVTAKVTLGVGTKANHVQSVELFTDAHPVTGPTVAALEAALRGTAPGATVLGYLERVDALSGRAEFLAAYATANATGGRDLQTATIDPSSTPASVKGAPLTAVDERTARALALMMARGQAYRMVSASGQDAARFEYHLRTAALKPTDLARITSGADSAVGFDPAKEAFQFQLDRVWGDNAVVVTFAKDGTARLEDVN